MNFFVPGIPRPQGSKKGFVNKKTGGVILTESGGQAHKDWRAVVALAGSQAMGNEPLWEGPLFVSLEFFLPRPKSAPKSREWPSTRPDIDKLARSVLDALTHICWVDDAQIVTLELRKRWQHWIDPDTQQPIGLNVFIQPQEEDEEA